MKSLPVLFCMLVSMASCNGDANREKLLRPEKMEAVLHDYLESEIYVHDFLSADAVISDSFEMAVAQERIFSKHGVSREQFIHSLEYYSGHGDEFLPIIDSLLAKKSAETVDKKIEIEPSVKRRKNKLIRELK
jgi:hypothetical protein